jgi:hypothetical protein
MNIHTFNHHQAGFLNKRFEYPLNMSIDHILIFHIYDILTEALSERYHHQRCSRA